MADSTYTAGEPLKSSPNPALHLAIAACKGAAALAIVLEKHVGIDGAASVIHGAMLNSLRESTDSKDPPEQFLLQKLFGPNYPV